jgi:hypothetical protein
MNEQQISITLISKINELYNWINRYNDIIHDLEDSILKIAQNQKKLIEQKHSIKFNSLENSILRIKKNQKRTIKRKEKNTIDDKNLEERIIELEKKIKKLEKFEKVTRNKLKIF